VLELELSEESPNTPGDRTTTIEEAELRAPEETPNITQADDPLASARTTTHGSAGEQLLQAAYGTTVRADRFYQEQVLDHLNPKMAEFAGRMEMAFVATSDASGECDCSLRTGPAGFLQVLNEQTLAYPEYRGNGVLASLGNISENARIGVLMVDFVTDLIGLHVNGSASIVEDAVLRGEYPDLPVDAERGRTPERWVLVHVAEAYVHCRKHIPRMVPVDRMRGWGTDDPLPKGGDYFEVKTTVQAAAVVSPA
jgi:predicted pyridoxine 5'-phosphate oxidase superfamily flavin-nucleotide-binding protein